MLKPFQHSGQFAPSSRRVVSPRESVRCQLRSDRRAEINGASEVAGSGVLRARVLELAQLAPAGSGTEAPVFRSVPAAVVERGGRVKFSGCA